MNDRQAEKLICAVECLVRAATHTAEHLENLLHCQPNRITKQDLNDAEARILEAIRKTKDAELKTITETLKHSSDALGEAVAENQPK